MFASSLLNETHGVSLEGLSLLPAKVCPQDQPCPLCQLQACRHGCRVVLQIIWKTIFPGMPWCAGEPACTAVSWTVSVQQANGKSRDIPPLCCSSPPPRSAGTALHFSCSRAYLCRTLPKTILKIRIIKFDLLRNRMSC